MSVNAKYEILKIPKTRRTLVDVLEIGLKKHYTPALIEVDITLARQLLQKRKKLKGSKVSLLSWILKCVAQALDGNKIIQALPHKNKMIVFDDVDISIVVERESEATYLINKKLAMPYIVRKVNEKSLPEIYNEIESAKTEKIEKYDVTLGAEKNTFESRIFISLPKILRYLI
ncbi:MAG: 2-oxo acid dehydrogenase subunit E2, partial [Ignavibacteriaceae bacterium]|nr:2-oxo acid dehydrogenase subunit E2 [Ignavibacteriaceae bacterium]